MPNLPIYFYVLGVKWELRYFTEEECRVDEAWARCFKDNYLIKIRPDVTGFLLVDSLLHEIIHAVYHVMNVEDGAEEERIATCVGTGLATLFDDERNTEIIDLITDISSTDNYV